MHAIRLVSAAAALLTLALACCFPSNRDPNGTDPEPESAPDPHGIGPPGPAPWVQTFADLAFAPTALPGAHVAGERFDTYDYQIAGLNTPSLMIGRGPDPEKKWFLMSLGSTLPAPGQFAPPGGIRFRAERHVLTVDRALYSIDSGPLASWFLLVDRDGTGRATQIHVANRRYLLENFADLAAMAGLP